MALNLREYLRLDFATNLRYLLAKDSCEWCGSKEDLNLHHVDRFHNLLIDTLQELNVNELSDISDYPEETLILIRDKMISKQLRSEYKTLCKSCHEKIHSIESKSDIYKDKTYNPYGTYFFVNLDAMTNLKSQYILRFIYLCCFVKYENKLTFGNAKDGKNNMTTKDLLEILKLGATETRRTINIFIESGLIEVDSDKNISIRKDIMYKGFKPYGNVKYTRLFSDFVMQLYEVLNPKEHRVIGRIFNLFNSVDNFNCLYENNKSLNLTGIYKALGYKNSNTTNLTLFTSNKLIICCKSSYYINPAFMYNGYLTEQLKDLERLLVDNK